MKVIFMVLINTTNFIIDILVLATCTSCDRLPLTFMLESGCANLKYMLYAQIFLQPQFVHQREHYLLYYMLSVARGGVLVKALHYKQAGRGFDSRGCHRNFPVT